jgi:hypothetical protein
MKNFLLDLWDWFLEATGIAPYIRSRLFYEADKLYIRGRYCGDANDLLEALKIIYYKE